MDAIAEHEHIPNIVATELGNYLVHVASGIPTIHRFISEDIELAEKRGDREHAVALRVTLRHFVQTYVSAA